MIFLTLTVMQKKNFFIVKVTLNLQDVIQGMEYIIFQYLSKESRHMYVSKYYEKVQKVLILRCAKIPLAFKKYFIRIFLKL